ncbi:MAG: HAD family hydrolase [Planctomycetota bacterium]|nr:HAD family hydrolase [Planctomycetota bacterium]
MTATRIAMWSGPRNISTAMMRSFENRPDTVVVDEPLYAHYLKATGLEHPVAELVMDSQPTDWREVTAQLLAPLPEGATIFYQKHMSHHLLENIEREWMRGLTHAFLIRDPRAMLASYTQKREEVTLEDLGLPQQVALYDWLEAELGTAAPIVDSRDVLLAPEAMLRALCPLLGIEFTGAMLAWPAGRRDSDGVWASWWYNAVMRSTGFQPYKPKDIQLDDELEAIATAAQPLYDYLFERRLTVG